MQRKSKELHFKFWSNCNQVLNHICRCTVALNQNEVQQIQALVLTFPFHSCLKTRVHPENICVTFSQWLTTYCSWKTYRSALLLRVTASGSAQTQSHAISFHVNTTPHPLRTPVGFRSHPGTPSGPAVFHLNEWSRYSVLELSLASLVAVWTSYVAFILRESFESAFQRTVKLSVHPRLRVRIDPTHLGCNAIINTFLTG